MSEANVLTEKKKSKWPLVAGPAVFITSFFLTTPDPFYPSLLIMAAITIWIALWWLTEVTHIAVTSFLPFILLPATGIVDIKIVAAQYMDPILFLFIGGFMIAFSIEKWGLHHRLALRILSSTGKSSSSILFGIMLTTYFMSMWISNTATVMMLLSAVFAVIVHLKKHISNPFDHRKTSSALLIGLAYAASIGGMATLVGTPTNMIFFKSYNEHYGAEHPINFLNWMSFAFPMSFVFLLFSFLVLRFFLLSKTASVQIDNSIFKVDQARLGKWSTDEKKVAALFLLTAVLWFSRADLQIGDFYFSGWASLFSYPTQITDSTVAIFITILLFLIPSSTEKGRNLLSWNEASKLPYEIILLFGSGFALAKGFEISGLSNWLAQYLHEFKSIPLALMILLLCIIVTIISEFASNVASIQLILPILISLQPAFTSDPATLLVPAALSASLGFMLPIATAPNTIVFASGYIKVKEMALVGLLINCIGILLITLFSLYVI